MLPLSIVTLTKNNERTLADTLKSVSGWADEIVIVDSGSTDGTLKIAENFNCKIFQREFTGFGEQKSFGVSSARNDWVMIVDSDEIVGEDLKKEISAKLNSSDCAGYNVPITLVFMNRIMKGRENKLPHLRLFNRKFGGYDNSMVHENIHVNGKVCTLENHILHHSYSDLDEYFEKFNFYTGLAANDLFKKGKKVSTAAIVFRLPIQFIQTYFFHGNIMNGYPGFLWSLCSSFYPVVKYAKLKEKTENKAK